MDKIIIEKAKNFVHKETENNVRPLFDLANEQGQILAEKLGAHKDIVLLGTLFMDVKRRQAMQEGRVNQHVQMSLDAAKDFFKDFDLSEDICNKIYNCIEAHHAEVPFTCLEAEICANADCYKFLHPKGIFQFVGILSDRKIDFASILDAVEEKMDEKWEILSLDICKSELEEYYFSFKKAIDTARKF